MVAMNIFRLSGDLLHVIAVCMILYRLFVKKNAQGISLRTQDLLFYVNLARYMDLFTSFYSLYNSALKAFYITSSGFICCSVRWVAPINSTYRADHDVAGPWWRHAWLPCLAIAILLAMLFRPFFEWLEVLWTSSFFLEPVALIPQAVMYRRYREVESLTGGTFLLLMGLYRFLYILNWILRVHSELRYKRHVLIELCGCAQVVVASWGLFWYSAGEHPTAPLLPQLFQFCRDTYWIMLALSVAFTLGPIYAGIFGSRFDMQDIVLGSVACILVLVPCACFVYLQATNYYAQSTAGPHDDAEAPTNDAAAAHDQDPTTELSVPLLLNTSIDEAEPTLPAELSFSEGQYHAPTTTEPTGLKDTMMVV